MTSFSLRIFIAAVVTFAAAESYSAQAIGVAVDASTTVTGSGPNGTREIVKDSPIFQDDRLKATKSGNAQIILVDKTRIVVGPGAQVDIDDFVFSSSNTFESVTIKATKGAFRFISGNSKSAAYKIQTPSGTIGIRGTAFDVGIVGGQVHVVMVRGAVQLCPRGGTCQELKGTCSYGVMGGGKVDLEGSLRQKGRAQKSKFPLMANEKALKSQFRQGGDCATVAALPPLDRQKTAPAPSVSPPTPSLSPQAPDRAPNSPKSGFGDGSNPGKGGDKNNSGNTGVGNPGGNKG